MNSYADAEMRKCDHSTVQLIDRQMRSTKPTLPSPKLSTFFPKIMSGRAKVGYVRYYVKVFSWILPQIAEMPSSLHPPPPPFCQASGQMSCPSFFMMIFVPLPLVAEFSRVNYCDRHISPNCGIRAWCVVLLLLARTNSARN